MNNLHLIETLKQSLKRTQDARGKLSLRLTEIESETAPNWGDAQRLAAEIELLTENILDTEKAIKSLEKGLNNHFGLGSLK